MSEFENDQVQMPEVALIRQEDEDEQEEDEDEQDEEDDLQGQQGIPQHQDNIAAGGGGGAFVVGGADNGGAQAVENLPGGNRILGLVEPGRMEITPTERQQALAIKAAANNCHELDPVKDFLYAQLALIDGDDIEKALERLHHMQYFKQEYAINDTAEDGNQIFREYLRLLPKFHLCFTYNHDGGNYVVVYDNAAFDKSVFNTEAKVRCWLGGTYYTLIAMNPDFEAVRRGTIMILECEGLSWSRIFLDGLKRMVSEVVAIHPLRVEKVKYFNAGVTMTTVAAMIKPVLPRHMREALEFGAQCDQRLDDIFLIPSADAANQRFLARIGDTLQRRYENENAFRL